MSPVTLKMRSWPYGEEAPVDGELPFPVDARQMSLFAAAWTVGCLKYLAGAGPDSLTYYETTGWRGLMELDEGCPLPDRFLSWPGCVFPVYHVFADLADARGVLRDLQTSAALSVDGIAIESDGTLRVTVANLTSASQRVRVGGLPAEHVGSRVLDHTTAHQAMDDPESFRLDVRTLEVVEGAVHLDLEPFAQVHLVCATG